MLTGSMPPSLRVQRQVPLVGEGQGSQPWPRTPKTWPLGPLSSVCPPFHHLLFNCWLVNDLLPTIGSGFITTLVCVLEIPNLGLCFRAMHRALFLTRSLLVERNTHMSRSRQIILGQDDEKATAEKFTLIFVFADAG